MGILNKKSMSETTTVARSKQFSINWHDTFKSLKLFAGGGAANILLQMTEHRIYELDWWRVLEAAITTGLTYLGYNFFQGPKIVVTDPTKSQIKAVEEGGEAKIVK